MSYLRKATEDETGPFLHEGGGGGGGDDDDAGGGGGGGGAATPTLLRVGEKEDLGWNEKKENPWELVSAFTRAHVCNSQKKKFLVLDKFSPWNHFFQIFGVFYFFSLLFHTLLRRIFFLRVTQKINLIGIGSRTR